MIDQESGGVNGDQHQIGRVRAGLVERDGGEAHQAVRGPGGAGPQRDQEADEGGGPVHWQHERGQAAAVQHAHSALEQERRSTLRGRGRQQRRRPGGLSWLS